MFDFDTTYRIMVTDPGMDPNPTFYGLAVGVRPLREEYPDPFDGEMGYGFEWIPNSPHWPRKHAFLRVTHDSPDRIEALDTLAEKQGNHRLYVFEPLTLQKLAEVKDDISNYEQLVGQIGSDDDLQEFYRTDWLRDDWDANPPQIEEDVDALIARARTLQQAAQVSFRAARLAAEEATRMQEAKAAKVGDIHMWKDGPVEKQRDGTWDPVEEPGPAGTVVTSDGKHYQKQRDGGWREVPKRGSELPGEWKEKAEGLPENTEDAYTVDTPQGPVYTEERRKAVHEPILKSIFEGLRPVGEDQRPVAVLTMGLPAAGKSTAVQDTMRGDNYAHIDTDNIREAIPEFKQAVKQRAKNAGTIVNDEASSIADEALHKALKNRNNLVFEGVGADKEWMNYLVKELRKKRDYKVVVLVLHEEDVDAAITRAEDRGRRKGRFVPKDYIREAQPKIPGSFTSINKDIDEFSVYQSGRPPTLKWKSKEGHPEQVLDSAFVDRFLAHAKLEWWNYIAGHKLAESPEKPAYSDLDAILDMFERAWEADRSELEKMPERYNDGVIIPVEDPKPRK